MYYRGYFITDNLKVLNQFDQDCFPFRTFHSTVEAKKAVDDLADMNDKCAKFLIDQLQLPVKNNVVKLR